MTEATLKPGWTKVKFGEVVRLCTDRSSNPEADGIERYVGLEHLEPEDLRIRSWGLVADGTTFTSRFKPGQVLFGKRRAYQRKVAVADFEGVCSGDIYVLESSNPKHLLPELLPFICQTNQFFEYAVGTSMGSLSPRTNWKSLKEFDFLLPTLTEQKSLLNAFIAAEELFQSLKKGLSQAWLMKDSVAFDALKKGINLEQGSRGLNNCQPKKDWLFIKGQDLLDGNFLWALQDGNHGSQYPRSAELGDTGYPYLSASDIDEDGSVDLCKCRRLEPERANKLRIPSAKAGDVILCNNATVGRVTRIPSWDTPIVASTSTTYYRCNEEILRSDYLRLYLESEIFQSQLKSIMRQSTRNQVPITAQKKLLFIIPPLDVQDSLAALRNQLSVVQSQLKERIKKSLAIRRSISAVLEV